MCSSGRLYCWYSSSVDKQKDLILEADKQTSFIRTKPDTFQSNVQLPLISIRKTPFDFNFRKRSAYTLQSSIAAKNHSPLREAKPWLTICGIIYLHHISVCQWNHCFTSHFPKKGVRKLNATRLSLLPYYPTANSRENGRCYRHQREYKTQQKMHT